MLRTLYTGPGICAADLIYGAGYLCCGPYIRGRVFVLRTLYTGPGICIVSFKKKKKKRLGKYHLKTVQERQEGCEIRHVLYSAFYLM